MIDRGTLGGDYGVTTRRAGTADKELVMIEEGRTAHPLPALFDTHEIMPHCESTVSAVMAPRPV